MPTPAFGNLFGADLGQSAGSYFNDFVDSNIGPALDFGKTFMQVADVGKDALDRFGMTPFLEGFFDINGGHLTDFINKDYNWFTDTILGQAGTAWLGGDDSMMDALINGSFDYAGWLNATDGGILGAGAGAGQPVNNNNASGIGHAPADPTVNNYFNAELSKLYGMDRNTAYQEALANTAYQRAVADMKRAGLNPASIFGAGRGSGAGGVAFIGNGNSASGSSSSNSKLFASDTYGMIASLAGLATAVVTKKPQNFWLGQQAAQGVMQTMNVIDRKFSK